jgi:2-polyprenyl-3-methyl-5-hydroxy-6-metoxy-1,4-benzoquinol methylase
MSEEKLSNFFIKTGYRSRPNSRYFDDNLIEMEGIIHQPEVYDFARYLGHRLNCKYIIDIGCGQGDKLVKLYPDFCIIGIDYRKNIEHCKAKYDDFGRWIEYDLEQNNNLPIEKEILESSVIICSDTIEHLLNPTSLLTILKNLLEYAPLCLISTPERDLVRGKDDFGPPQNLHHIREWNIIEFSQ